MTEPTDDEKLHEEAEDIRKETAADAPELAEHDRIAELEAQLAEANSKALYAAAELQNSRRRMEKELADGKAYALGDGPAKLIASMTGTKMALRGREDIQE